MYKAAKLFLKTAARLYQVTQKAGHSDRSTKAGSFETTAGAMVSAQVCTYHYLMCTQALAYGGQLLSAEQKDEDKEKKHSDGRGRAAAAAAADSDSVVVSCYMAMLIVKKNTIWLDSCI